MAWRAARGAGTDNTEAAGARHWHAGWPHRHAGAAGPDTTRAGRPPCAGDADRPGSRPPSPARPRCARRVRGRRTPPPGTTLGSPQLDSFGPDFHLANELLARGRTESVLEYLDLCRRFWTLGHDALDGWTAELRAGRRPVLREFGIDPDDD